MKNKIPNAETIWRVPAYLPYVQPKLTDESIRNAEKRIGGSIPKEYLALLEKQNGGYIRYELPEIEHSIIAGIGPHYPNIFDTNWEEMQEYVSFPLEGLFPIDGDGHYYICIDYRQSSSPPVMTLADIECDDESLIAKSFNDYLLKLTLEAKVPYYLDSENRTIDEIKTILSESLNMIEVDIDINSDIESYGYRYHVLETKRNPISKCIDSLRNFLAEFGNGSPFLTPRYGDHISLSPNRVPKGFARSNEDRYDELKNLMPGTALRYPELSESCYLLNCTDGIREQLFEACDSNGIKLDSLQELLNES